jgi:hypothetical protein
MEALVADESKENSNLVKLAKFGEFRFIFILVIFGLYQSYPKSRRKSTMTVSAGNLMNHCTLCICCQMGTELFCVC